MTAQVDAVELVRLQLDQARREGRRAPGRPALIEATGLTDHAVRTALDKIKDAGDPSRAQGNTASAKRRQMAGTANKAVATDNDHPTTSPAGDLQSNASITPAPAHRTMSPTASSSERLATARRTEVTARQFPPSSRRTSQARPPLPRVGVHAGGSGALPTKRSGPRRGRAEPRLPSRRSLRTGSHLAVRRRLRRGAQGIPRPAGTPQAKPANRTRGARLNGHQPGRPSCAHSPRRSLALKFRTLLRNFSARLRRDAAGRRCPHPTLPGRSGRWKPDQDRARLRTEPTYRSSAARLGNSSSATVPDDDWKGSTQVRSTANPARQPDPGIRLGTGGTAGLRRDGSTCPAQRRSHRRPAVRRRIPLPHQRRRPGSRSRPVDEHLLTRRRQRRPAVQRNRRHGLRHPARRHRRLESLRTETEFRVERILADRLHHEPRPQADSRPRG